MARRGGWGLSAVLLTATAAGLGSAPISDATEVGEIREQMGGMLPGGHPQVALRLGHPAAGEPPSTPRRPANEVISLWDQAARLRQFSASIMPRV
jgi:nitroreductase